MEEAIKLWLKIGNVEKLQVIVVEKGRRKDQNVHNLGAGVALTKENHIIRQKKTRICIQKKRDPDII